MTTEDRPTIEAPPVNRFCEGEWVNLSPGAPSGQPQMRIRRDQIESVTREGKTTQWHEGAEIPCYSLTIRTKSGTDNRVHFSRYPEAERDCDLLIEACLGPPRTRMIEVNTAEFESTPGDDVYIAIDAITSIVPHHYEPRVFIYAATNTKIDGTPLIGRYRKKFATNEERDAFLRMCGAKVE